MQFDLRYLGHSGLQRSGDDLCVHFSPNLARPATFFDAEVKSPIRFREAISALHDVVVSDLRRPKKDRTAWKTYQAQEAQRERDLRAEIAQQAASAHMLKKRADIPKNLDSDFKRMHALYWKARTQWAYELMRTDPELFRHLVPCDPVVTVAPDVVFFECFSKDESSYACLSVDREAFSGAQDAALGTTNVDYSIALYDHFQELRTYRPTRLLVDPAGFSVAVHGQEEVREEKIDLPPSWLRGFGQLSAAMALPSRSVELSVDVVYSILTLLARRADKPGGRAIQFHLTPGAPPAVVVEPWGVRVVSSGPAYEGFGAEESASSGGGDKSPYRQAPARATAKTEVIKVWGRRRLFALARLLPLVTKFEVRLLGSGLPSVWIAHAGDMRLVLALSGWTANDWAAGANLDVLAGDLRDDDAVTTRLAATLQDRRVASFGELALGANGSDRAVLGGLFKLAKQGQVVFDYGVDKYRYRPILPVPLADAVLGPEPDEPREGKRLAREKTVTIVSQSVLGPGRIHVMAKVKNTPCEAIFTETGIARAKCQCSFFFKNGMRGGPCRHLLALRLTFSPPEPEPQRVVDSASPPGPITTGPAAQPVTGAPAKADAPSLPKPTDGLDVFTFRKDLVVDLEARANEQKRDARALLEEAWDLAGPRIQAKKTWKEALALAPGGAPFLESGFIAPPLLSRGTGLHPAVVTDIGKVANHLAASPSAVLNLAWLVYRKTKEGGGTG